MDVRTIRTELHRGAAVPDDAFDRIFPWTQRHRSRVHWTRIDVALRVSSMLAPAPGGHILDVGAGVGKMCLVGALTGDASWSGVEHCRFMVRAAQRSAHKLGIDRVTAFFHADALDMDWSPFGGIYMFNPFAETLLYPFGDPEFMQAVYDQEVLGVERKLATLQPGARVVTYAGFGGHIPADFDLVEEVQMHEESLALWIRRSSS